MITSFFRFPSFATSTIPAEVGMTSAQVTICIVVGTLTLSGLASAQDQEKRIKRSELPAPVEKAVVEQSQGSTIRGFSQEKENGKTFYEAELMTNGHSKDVLIDEDGDVVEVEEQVAMDSLSPAVGAALQSKAGGGKIVKIESLTKKGKLVAYEAQVRANGRKSEIQVGPGGESLAHEE
jgi:uncharacterized membrane protein YkoI